MVLKPVSMKRIAVLGLKRERQKVVSILHDLGVVQIEPLSKEVASIVKSERESDLYRHVSDQLLRIRALKSALPAIPVSTKIRFASTEEMMQTAESIKIDAKVALLQRERENLLTDLRETENNIKLLDEFSFFPGDLRVLHLSSAKSYFGRVDTTRFAAFRKALEPNANDVVLYSSEGKDTTRIVLVVFPAFPSHALATVVQAHGVHLEPVPKLTGRPDKIISEQKAVHAQISSKLQQIEGQLAEISKENYGKILSLEEQLEIETKKLEVLDGLGVTKDAFALEGWVPESRIEQLKRAFEKHSQGIFVYELHTEESPPTLFANPKRFRVFESFIRFYSLPSGEEFDPTLIFGLIFPVFYGMMLGDVGYGLVILLVSRWVIRRVQGGKRDLNIMPRPLMSFAKTILRPTQMVKLAKAMTPGAIIAIILGFMFNLYFGFHINQYLFQYLNHSLGLHLPADGAFLDPIGTFGLRKLLLISGYIGLGMVSFGLVLGIINAMREGEKKHVIGKLGWLVFGWGVVLTGLALLHHGHINPARHIEGIAYFGLIFGGIGLMFVGEGVRAIMELPSIVSHILSYTRIVGILLASVILADVIDFIFVKTLHHTIPYVVLGVIIFFIGHIFNIVLGVFEPGIQGARLIYVEFFSKFYHGNGRPFRPFGSSRKFTYDQFELKEEEKAASKS